MTDWDDWLADHRADRVEAGLHRELRTRSSDTRLIDLAGNDYLGLRRDPRVTAAAADALHQWGTGSGASRLVTGSLAVHRDLERALADFTGREQALVFSTGYHANLSVLSALSDPNTYVISDAHVHASLVDACRLARHGGLRIVRHNDLDDVRDALDERGTRRAIVLVESVYSVLGDAAPLPELATLVASHDGLLVVDEAHALGVSGVGGRGLVQAAGLADHRQVVVTGTLSKALGSQGGLVLARADIVEHLINTARPFIYDTALAPASAAAALAALAIIDADPTLPARARAIALAMAQALGLGEPAGCVVSLPMASPGHALHTQEELLRLGFAVGSFRPPSVPDGVSRIRLTANATLTHADTDALLEHLRHLVHAG